MRPHNNLHGTHGLDPDDPGVCGDINPAVNNREASEAFAARLRDAIASKTEFVTEGVKKADANEARVLRTVRGETHVFTASSIATLG